MEQRSYLADNLIAAIAVVVVVVVVVVAAAAYKRSMCCLKTHNLESECYLAFFQAKLL